MPTLFRFLVVVAVLAGLGFAAMFALATLVEPEPREITVPIPASAACRRDERARRLAGLFLDMLAAERGAAANTLDAYRRDLDDYARFPRGKTASTPPRPSRPRSGPSWRASRNGA